MMVETRRIGLTFPSERLSRDRQKAIVRAAGAERIIHVGIDCKDWRALSQAVRQGDTIYPAALSMMPTARTKDDVAPVDQVGEILAEFAHLGVTIHEALTGRSSDNREQRVRMMTEAIRNIRGGGRQLPKGSFSRGRPPADCSEVLAEAGKIWRSRAYSTNEAAVAHMPPCKDPKTGEPIAWTIERAYREFEASGRPFPKRKRK